MGSGRARVRGWSNAGVTVPTSCWLAGSLLSRIPHAPGARPGDSTAQTHRNATLARQSRMVGRASSGQATVAHADTPLFGPQDS